MSKTPYHDIVLARNKVNTARNHLDDAIGALISDHTDMPPTLEQADDTVAEIERYIKRAEREIDRAKGHLGISRDTHSAQSEVGGVWGMVDGDICERCDTAAHLTLQITHEIGNYAEYEAWCRECGEKIDSGTIKRENE